MKEKELSSADKCRRTKLRKKSVEELVSIIIRKDDTERRLSKSVETFKKLQEINDKRINTLQYSLDKSEEIQMSQDKAIAALNATLDIKVQGVVVHTRKYSSLSFNLKGTITVLASTSLYPCATS